MHKIMQLQLKSFHFMCKHSGTAHSMGLNLSETTDILGFSHTAVYRGCECCQKSPVSCSSGGEDVLLIREIRIEWQDCFQPLWWLRKLITFHKRSEHQNTHVDMDSPTPAEDLMRILSWHPSTGIRGSCEHRPSPNITRWWNPLHCVMDFWFVIISTGF